MAETVRVGLVFGDDSARNVLFRVREWKSTPSFVFTEEFQDDFMSQYHQVFDEARKNFLVGEMVWNFADFMTIQDVKRVVGNRKGVLTRQRQPKSSAHLLRLRYHSLFNSSEFVSYHGCPRYSVPVH